MGLLALLAAASDAGLSRDAAEALLWPESDKTRAASSLKQLVHSLRQQLGSPEVLLGTSTLRLNRELVSSDLVDFRTALDRGDAEAAVALYTGPFLDGFFIRGADGFERWGAAEGARLAARYAEALEVLAHRAEEGGDARGAAAWWRRLQATDPMNGRAAAGLMRALDAGGDRAGAIRHAQIYEALVREELGASAVDPAVLAVADELSRNRPGRAPAFQPESARSVGVDDSAPVHLPENRTEARAMVGVEAVADVAPPTGRPWHRTGAFIAFGLIGLMALGFYGWSTRGADRSTVATAQPSALVSVATRSVVVLPFANTSADPSDEPFVDGLTDELIGSLARVAGLKVAPRTSAFALKGKGLDMRTIADTLGVAHALEGSVRRVGDRLRITVALSSATENRVLWSETYDRQMRDVFAVQQDIARSVTRALRLTFADSPSGGPPSATADLVAYELYLKAQFFRYQLTRDALARSVGYFEQAVARDSSYALAYAGLADAHALLVLFGNEPPREGFRRARIAAMAALRLDSTLAQAHASLGHIEMVHDWNWTSAGHRLERAMTLDPASTTARVWRGIWLLDQRRFDEAAALLEQTLTSDPLSTAVRLTLGRIHVSRGAPDRAMPYLNSALELNPRLSLAHQQRGHALLQRGEKAQAIAEFAQAAALSGARDSAQLAFAYGVTGRRSEAERIVDALDRSSSRRYVSPFDMAVAYAGLGDRERAFRALARAQEEHAAGMDVIAITPALAPLHDDARWRPLLRAMGLSP